MNISKWLEPTDNHSWPIHNGKFERKSRWMNLIESDLNQHNFFLPWSKVPRLPCLHNSLRERSNVFLTNRIKMKHFSKKIRTLVSFSHGHRQLNWKETDSTATTASVSCACTKTLCSRASCLPPRGQSCACQLHTLKRGLWRRHC